MKHFKQLTLIILTLSLLLCGCGGAQANGTNDNTGNNSAQDNTNNNLIVEKDEYTLSEYISTGETIWFLTYGYGKDDKIDQIFVFEPNGTLYYCDCDWKIGEAEQKDDSEIISYVKQEYEKAMTEKINRLISWEGEVIEDYNLLTSETSSLYSPYLENIEPGQYKFSIISDSTGNNTEREVIAYQEFAPVTFDDNLWDCVARITYVKLSYIYQYESDKGSTNCFQVYDSWYGGYAVEYITTYADYLDKNAKTREYLLTRLDSSKHFTLDEVGTANIGIDNADSLFEEIIMDLKWESVQPEDY